LNRRMK